MEELIPGLQPLVLWMSNSIELLHFVQHEVPQLLPWRQDQEDEGVYYFYICHAHSCKTCSVYVCAIKTYLFVLSGLLDSEMSSTRTACEEAMTVLEEVIMFTFQQSVYYLTKVGCNTLLHTVFKKI